MTEPRRPRAKRRLSLLARGLIAILVGLAVWVLRDVDLPPGSGEPAAPPPVEVPVPDATPPGGAPSQGPPAHLSPSGMVVPVAGVRPEDLRDSFFDARGNRVHDALDILAPTGTPVLAVADGVVQKLFLSEPGGITLYQFDSDEEYCFYYAHLDRYADGLEEGDPITRGQVIGYVGSTGNAAADAPHLHFSINRLGPEKKWWEGEPVNPYPILHDGRRL